MHAKSELAMQLSIFADFYLACITPYNRVYEDFGALRVDMIVVRACSFAAEGYFFSISKHSRVAQSGKSGERRQYNNTLMSLINVTIRLFFPSIYSLILGPVLTPIRAVLTSK